MTLTGGARRSAAVREGEGGELGRGGGKRAGRANWTSGEKGGRGWGGPVIRLGRAGERG
jgi:hypothetical protein